MAGTDRIKGVLCPVCSQDLERYSQVEHFANVHPEYEFVRVIRPGGRTRFACKLCGAAPGGADKIVKHYKLRHAVHLVQYTGKGQVVAALGSAPSEFDVQKTADIIGYLVDRNRQLVAENEQWITEVETLQGEVARVKQELAQWQTKYNATLDGGNKLAARLAEAQQLLARRD